MKHAVSQCTSDNIDDAVWEFVKATTEFFSSIPTHLTTSAYEIEEYTTLDLDQKWFEISMYFYYTANI
jgi:hypothetical protein